jgi:hypothetical protein
MSGIIGNLSRCNTHIGIAVSRTKLFGNTNERCGVRHAVHVK